MVTKRIKINDSFVINALRNCGYNNYSAIADIIDNSLEPEVNASFVRVAFETANETSTDPYTNSPCQVLKSLYIIDDGNGMTSDILEEAMSLGSETGKNGTNNLGMYGAGLKTASFSIGQCLEVYSKTSKSDLNYAVISLVDAINSNGVINVNYSTFKKTSPEYKTFSTAVNGDHGTVVKISNLDKLTNKSFYSFKKTIKSKIGESFNKYIFSNVVKFYVQDEEVPYVDLMGNSDTNELMGETDFTVDGNTIRLKAWFIPNVGGDDPNALDEVHEIKKDGSEYTSRTSNNQGLYIYRQNRLIGKALTLGMWVKHPLKNGFRCELFIDGNCDYLFGSTFTKMVGEKTKDTIHQGFYEELCKAINPYVLEVAKREAKDINARKENDPEAKKRTEEFYKKVTEKQNKNMMLKANRNKEHRPDSGKEVQHRGPQKNPNPNRAPHTSKWLDGFEERPMGRTAEMYTMERTNGKRIILINTDHPFYQKLYSRLNNELKFIMAQYISCEEIAKQNVNYYGSDDIQTTIDMYNEYMSSEVYKSLLF